MEKGEQTDFKKPKSTIGRVNQLEEVMGILHEEPTPLRTRINIIAEGIFGTTEKFLEENPDIPTQVKILYRTIFETDEEAEQIRREKRRKRKEMQREYIDYTPITHDSCFGAGPRNYRGC